MVELEDVVEALVVGRRVVEVVSGAVLDDGMTEGEEVPLGGAVSGEVELEPEPIDGSVEVVPTESGDDEDDDDDDDEELGEDELDDDGGTDGVSVPLVALAGSTEEVVVSSEFDDVDGGTEVEPESNSSGVVVVGSTVSTGSVSVVDEPVGSLDAVVSGAGSDPSGDPVVASSSLSPEPGCPMLRSVRSASVTTDAEPAPVPVVPSPSAVGVSLEPPHALSEVTTIRHDAPNTAAREPARRIRQCSIRRSTHTVCRRTHEEPPHITT